MLIVWNWPKKGKGTNKKDKEEGKVAFAPRKGYTGGKVLSGPYGRKEKNPSQKRKKTRHCSRKRAQRHL